MYVKSVQVGQNFLYHWKTFPIVLPPTAITTTVNENDSTNQSGKFCLTCAIFVE